MSHRSFFGRWAPVLVWAACISSLSTSLFTGQRTGSLLLPLLSTLFPGAHPEHLLLLHAAIRKLAHFTEYAILSWLLFRALRRDGTWSARPALLALVIAGLFSIGDEFHQSFVPGRTPAPTDCLIDFSGAAAGQGLIAVWSRPGRS